MMSSCGRKKILIKSAFCGFYYLSQAPLTDILSIVNQNLFKAKKNTSKEYWELSLRQHPQDHNRCSLVSTDTTITSTFFFRPRNLCPMNEGAPPPPWIEPGPSRHLLNFSTFLCGGFWGWRLWMFSFANNTLINKLIVNQDRIMDRVRVGKRKVYLTLWISPKLILDQLIAWNESEVGFRRGPQTFNQCGPERTQQSPLQYSALFCPEVVACKLDEVSNNDLQCLDVPGIRLSFNQKL